MTSRIGFVVLVGVAVLAGCALGNSYEQVATDYRDSARELNAILKSCTDEASARAAVPKLAAVEQRFRQIAAKAEGLGKPSEADLKTVGSVLQADASLSSDYVQEQQRLLLSGPEWPIIKDSLNRVKDAMEAARKAMVS